VPKDYGVFAAYGALWERAAEVNPRFFDWARQYYMRFQSAHESEGRREPRYAALSQWTAEHLRRKEIVDAAPAPAPDKTAEELILEGKELETKSSSPLANAEAHGKYTAAIRLLEKKFGGSAGRQTEGSSDRCPPSPRQRARTGRRPARRRRGREARDRSQPESVGRLYPAGRDDLRQRGKARPL
jgi:hypothetical protein